MRIKTLILWLLLFKKTSWIILAIGRCIPINRFIKYHKILNCYKSTLPVIAWRTVENLTACRNFATGKRGLAFNYSPSEAATISKEYVINCQIIGCPEVGHSSTLVPDPKFDYYSAYGNLSTIANATCIKSVGLFELVPDKLNYTQAVTHCQIVGADLADIRTEMRTNNIAALVQSVKGWYKAAYVGLDDLDTEGLFETPMGYPLSCTKFRLYLATIEFGRHMNAKIPVTAWSPGHPRKGRENEDCVILDANKVWRAINCKIRLPFVCEFFPNAPTSTQIEFKKVNCTTIVNKKKRGKCLKEKEFFDLINNSSRIDKCALVNGLFADQKLDKDIE